MATTRDAILSRLNSVCSGTPFVFGQAVSPFDFSHQPSGNIDQVSRVTVEGQSVIGGLNFSEERTDLVTVWIARKQAAAPQLAYRLLVIDVTSLTAAVTRDGATGGGDYAVLDGSGMSLEHKDGQEFAVARLSLPINYETQL